MSNKNNNPSPSNSQATQSWASPENTFEDIGLQEIKYTIAKANYILKEADGDVVRQYRNATFRGVTLGDSGKPQRIDAAGDVETFLVSLCLYNGDGKTVPLHTVRSWPSRISKALFEKAKDISDLGEEDTMEDLLKQQEDIKKRIEEFDSVKND